MKTKIIIGESVEESEIRVKKYASGMEVVESGDAHINVVGKKPIFEKKMKVNKEEKKELFNKPDNFKVVDGRLVRKVKKQ